MRFNRSLEEASFIKNDGVMVDATFVNASRLRNSHGENKTIKDGGIPEEWKNEEDKKTVHKVSHKDTDARWAKKRDETHYGYKNHVKADVGSKLIARENRQLQLAVQNSLTVTGIKKRTYTPKCEPRHEATLPVKSYTMEKNISDYESLNHSTWECKYHIVLIPKYRRKKLYKSIREDFGQEIGGWQDAVSVGYWKII